MGRKTSSTSCGPSGGGALQALLEILADEERLHQEERAVVGVAPHVEDLDDVGVLEHGRAPRLAAEALHLRVAAGEPRRGAS